jgi:hypothetical protein
LHEKIAASAVVKMEESKLVDQIQALSLDGERTRSTSDVSEKSDEELELDNNSYNINDIFELLPYSEVQHLWLIILIFDVVFFYFQ